MHLNLTCYYKLITKLRNSRTSVNCFIDVVLFTLIHFLFIVNRPPKVQMMIQYTHLEQNSWITRKITFIYRHKYSINKYINDFTQSSIDKNNSDLVFRHQTCVKQKQGKEHLTPCDGTETAILFPTPREAVYRTETFSHSLISSSL